MAGSLTNDVIHLRLPLKPEYLPVLRAAVGVIAGTMSFDYDEIIQLRVAVTEVADLASKHADPQRRDQEAAELDIRFLNRRDSLEIHIAAPSDYLGGLETSENEESHALLRSLMDTVEFGGEGKVVRMVKYRREHG